MKLAAIATRDQATISLTPAAKKLWSYRTLIQVVLSICCCALSLSVSSTNAEASFVITNKDLQESLQSTRRLISNSPKLSLDRAQTILDQARRTQEPEAEMYAEVLLGKIYEELDDLEQAGEHYLKAQKIEQQLNASKRDPDISFFLADGLRFVDAHTAALAYINNGIAIQRIFGDEDYLMRAHDLKSSLHYSLKQFKQSEQSSQSALAIAEARDNDEFMLRSYRKIAKAAKKLGDSKKSLDFNSRALLIAQAMGDEALIAKHREYVSTDQRVLGMYAQALDNANKALLVQRELNNEYRVSNLLLNLSIIYMKLSSHDQSLAYAFELLSLHENTGNENRIASACNQIGLIFSRLDRLDDASAYHERVLSLNKDKIKANYRASALRSLATIKLKTDDYQSALDYAQKAETIYKNLGDNSGLATVNFSTAEIYSALENDGRALDYHQLVIQLAQKVGDRWTEARSHIAKGKLLTKMNYRSGRQSLEQGLEIANQIGAKTLALKGYNALIEAERSQGNHQQALKYYDTAFMLVREIDNTEVDRRIAELKIVHDVQEREREIESLRRNMQISQLEINQQASELENLNNKNLIAGLQLKEQRAQRVYLIGIAVIFGLVIYFLFMRYRYLSSAQKILNDRNKEIELKNTHLAELNLTKDRFFSILSHDLRGPVAKIVARTDMLSEFYDKLSRDKAKNYVKEIHSSSNQVYSLLENLLSWASIQLKNANPFFALYDAHDICEAVVQELDQSAEEKEIQLQNTVPLGAKIYADKNMIRTALRNLVANAIKFTPHNGSIKLISEASEAEITIHIRDSGVGIKNEDQQRLFNITNLQSKQGTDGEEGTGLGLTLCKTLIEKNGGQLNFKSEEGKGSDFYFTLPSNAPRVQDEL